MTSAWFYGDNRRDENPLEFLTDFEAALTRLPHLSESAKCQRFYNHCKSDFEAEDWYENLEKNSPAVVASWPILVLHFQVKWLGATPDTLLKTPSTKLVTTTQPDAATTVSRETTTTTTTAIPAPANTAVRATYETTTPQRPNRVTNTRHVIATPTPILTQLEPDSEATTTIHKATTVPELPDRDTRRITTLPTLEQVQIEADPAATEGHRDEEREMGRVEKLKEDREEVPEMRVEALALDIEEQETIGMTQSEVRNPAASPTARVAANARPHEPAWFDWAAEVDEALGLCPIAHNTPQPEPVNPVPGDVPIDPVRTVRTSAAPVVNPIPGDKTVDPVRTAFANAVPAVPVPVDPTPGSPTNPVRTAPIDPVPVNPVPVRTVFANPASGNTTTPFVHPLHADSTADPSPVTRVNSIDITPTEYVHVDPMSRTLITLFIHQALISASLLIYSTNFALASRTHANAVLLKFCSVLFSSFGVRELDRESWIANEGVRYLGGGALVVVSYAHFLWCQGSLGGFRSPDCLVLVVCQ